MTGKDYGFSTKTAAAALLEVASDPEVVEAIRAYQEGMTPSWFTTYKPSRRLFLEKKT
jgi:phage terminase small subunit